MNTMTYKKYVGTVEYSDKDGILWGRVLGIEDMIDYEGESIAELRMDFENAINQYLKFCRKNGKKPNKPRQGKITLTLPLEIEAGLEQVVEDTGRSANALILEAVRDAYFPSNKKSVTRNKKTSQSTSHKRPAQLA